MASGSIPHHPNIHKQWRHLIYGPLSKLPGSSNQSRYILIVDALDECEDENDIRTILELLAEAQSLETVQLRVFLTSRPEVPIRNSFDHPRCRASGFCTPQNIVVDCRSRYPHILAARARTYCS
ncbi:hypothetical protein P152DRAFT_460833 [Eremomyces bilateralis CBS 781.70]|uniref:Nephrocystin 3-like N-terminal domain-containing protein n=1 Tax=Eremomyces bilateralis CBS 781.70 TaxID=1392243 RepID=A0A6G1FVT5_9PEZI|nr:uncharacterized protein P152DRAFT_460833 [Eremomyces bilateralis CBS 781.70]KAF1810015.1 hypothetical protein P152DRAFT_460833 [Eremomyces bilateralis CBS 781.70]